MASDRTPSAAAILIAQGLIERTYSNDHALAKAIALALDKYAAESAEVKEIDAAVDGYKYRTEVAERQLAIRAKLYEYREDMKCDDPEHKGFPMISAGDKFHCYGCWQDEEIGRLERQFADVTDQLINLYKEATGHVSTILTAREIIKALQEALDRERGQWVRVEDALPELGWQVLCFSKDRTIRQDARQGVGGWFDLAVTHWRPLPQPPKEGK